LRSAIKDQITRRRVVRECLAQLLNNPGACRLECFDSYNFDYTYSDTAKSRKCLQIQT
jgi:predicted transcriptional regulator